MMVEDFLSPALLYMEQCVHVDIWQKTAKFCKADILNYGNNFICNKD